MLFTRTVSYFAPVPREQPRDSSTSLLESGRRTTQILALGVPRLATSSAYLAWPSLLSGLYLQGVESGTTQRKGTSSNLSPERPRKNSSR